MRAAALGLVALCAGLPAQAAPPAAQVAKLVAPERLPFDRFGASVAIDGDAGVVGAPDSTIAAFPQAGRSLARARGAGGWTVAAVLDPTKDTSGQRRLGHAATIRGGLQVVGAPGYYDAGFTGATYVYRLMGDKYELDTLLKAPDKAVDLAFGFAATLAQDRLMLGTYIELNVPGRAHAFVRVKPGQWTGPQTLTAGDAAPGDRFGSALAARDERAVIGAPGADVARGAAYVFAWQNGAWVQIAKLVADDRAAGDAFGGSVAVDGATIVVGAPGRTDGSGVAYAFREIAGVWVQVAVLAPDVPESTSYFATRVALRDPYAVITAYNRDKDPANPGIGGRGRAYWYGRRPDDSWVLLADVVAGDGVPGDHLGLGVDLAGGEAFVGAPGDDAGLGALYVFRLAQAEGDPCLDHPDCENGPCCDGVCEPLGACEVDATTSTTGDGESSGTGAQPTGDATSTPGTSTGEPPDGPGPPRLDLEPATDGGCGCASGQAPWFAALVVLLGLPGRRRGRATSRA